MYKLVALNATDVDIFQKTSHYEVAKQFNKATEKMEAEIALAKLMITKTHRAAAAA